MVKIARNTAHILPNGTNTGPGVVQIDDSWGFGQVLAVVMIFVNFKEVLHYLFGGPPRERQAQTEEIVYQPLGPFVSSSRPLPTNTFAPIQISGLSQTQYHTGVDSYSSVRTSLIYRP